MYQINFNKPVKIHFMGIGGISMSGLAEILHAKGFTVVGSDARESAIPTTWHLWAFKLPMARKQKILHLISTLLFTQQPFILTIRSLLLQKLPDFQ